MEARAAAPVGIVLLILPVALLTEEVARLIRHGVEIY